MYKILQFILVFGFFFKILEVYNLPIVVLISIVYLLLFLNISPTHLIKAFSTKSSANFILFILFLFFQNIIGLGDIRLSFIFLSQYLLFLTVSTYSFYKSSLNLLLKPVVITSIISSIILLFQVSGFEIWPSRLFQKLGLIDLKQRDYNSIENVFRSRGIGLSTTVTDFATHISLLLILKTKYKFSKILGYLSFFINRSFAGFLSIITIKFINRFNWSRLILILTIGFISILFVSNSSLSNFLSSDDSFLSRSVMWYRALIIFKSNPIIGVGLGTNIDLAQNIDGLFGLSFGNVRIAFHSMYFDFLSGTGLIGFTIFMLFLLRTYQKTKLNTPLKALFLFQLIFALFNNNHYMSYDIALISGLINGLEKS